MAVSPVTMAILRLYKQPSDVLEVKPYRLKKEDKPCKVRTVEDGLSTVIKTCCHREKKCISNKMYMIPAAVPQVVNYFKGRWTKYPTLDTAAKFMSRNLGILNNPKI